MWLDDVDDATHTSFWSGDPVQVWSCNGGPQQQWQPVCEGVDQWGDYGYALFNKASSKASTPGMTLPGTPPRAATRCCISYFNQARYY